MSININIFRDYIYYLKSGGRLVADLGLLYDLKGQTVF